MSDPLYLVQALQHENVKAFLWMLRYGEGTSGPDGYRTLFGGELFKGPDGVYDTFDDFTDHPRKLVTRMFGKPKRPISSTAAGAYQFLSRTWDGVAKQWGLLDFTPTNQDLGCVALIKGRKALEDVIAGRFDVAVMKCNKEWASLPGSPYGQPVVTIEEARDHYRKHGGWIAGIIDVQATVVQTLPQLEAPKEPEMPAPFLMAAIPSIIAAIPELAKMFSSGSPASERNIKAAEVVVGIAKEAIGAKNEQELVESMESDPTAKEAVRAAVKSQWFKIEEIGGGIVAARESNAKAQGTKGMWHNPAVWITAALLPLVYGVVYIVLTGSTDNFSTETKAMVVAAIVSGVLGAILGYWLGTSASSARKDDSIIAKAIGD